MNTRSSPEPASDRATTRPSAAEFIGSFPDPLVALDPVLPEIAFLGRSNVGKSSLLNSLVGIKGLAKVSSTPGKTQAMNVFRVGPETRAKGPWDRASADRGPRPPVPGEYY